MTDEEIISLAKATATKYKELRETLPYSANIITELHANENAHSRILRLLLEYKRDRKYPIFESFIKYINSHFNTDDKNKIDIKIEKPEFTNESDRIDILIKENTESNKYAIIVENKVCNAVDQDHQIENYTEKCINKHKIDKANIYALYLTRDGSKKISDYSLTEDAKKNLDYKSEEATGRFLPIDYKTHILPWLEKEVLPNTPYREKLLISALEQYINYVKKMLCLREEDEEINKKLENFIDNKLNNKNSLELENLVKIYSKLSEQLKIKIENLKNKIGESESSNLLEEEYLELHERIIKIKNQKLNEWIINIGKDKVLLQLENLLKNRTDGSKITEYEFSDGWYHIVIENNNMKNTRFFVTNDADFRPIFSGIWKKEGFTVSEETEKKLTENHKKFENTYQFSAYERGLTEKSFWKKVESGKVNLAEHIFKRYNETIDNLKGIQL